MLKNGQKLHIRTIIISVVLDLFRIAIIGRLLPVKIFFSAVCAAEELEETAKLLVALRDNDVRLLSQRYVDDLMTTLGIRDEQLQLQTHSVTVHVSGEGYSTAWDTPIGVY